MVKTKEQKNEIMLDECGGSFFREFIANIQNKCYIDMIIEYVDS